VIELRFIERDGKRILQYRTCGHYHTTGYDSSPDTGSEMSDHYWTLWRDVPFKSNPDPSGY
jgi:hypothetical protein